MTYLSGRCSMRKTESRIQTDTFDWDSNTASRKGSKRERRHPHRRGPPRRRRDWLQPKLKKSCTYSGDTGTRNRTIPCRSSSYRHA